MNPLFQNSLKRTPQQIPPIWFMRQAGRYHDHYQKLRAKHSFMDLCKVPELAAEVALGPILDFDFDVSILFSDLLFPLEAMGMGLEYTDHGPKLGWQLNSSSIHQLRLWPDALPALEFQASAVKLTRERLPKHKSLIGFVGSPWTLFTYAVQGGHSGALTEAKAQLDLWPKWLEILIPLLERNIELQLNNGAEVVMVFDTAAGELDPRTYSDMIVGPLAQLSARYPNKLGYYSKWTTEAHWSDSRLNNAPWAGIGCDHRWDLTKAFNIRTNGFVQGNFDQALLFAPEGQIFRNHVLRFLEPFKRLSPEKRAGWVCGLGHGVLPKTPMNNVRAFVDLVRRSFE